MPTEFSARIRSKNIKTLKTQPLDVLVIGGGIVGAGVIRDLALNGGIKAGLIEQGDFANGTSSATSPADSRRVSLYPSTRHRSR